MRAKLYRRAIDGMSGWKNKGKEIGIAVFWIAVLVLGFVGFLWVRVYLMRSHWAAQGLEAYTDRAFASEAKFYLSLAVSAIWTVIWLGYSAYHGYRLWRSINVVAQNEAIMLKRFLAGLVCTGVGAYGVYLVITLESKFYW